MDEESYDQYYKKIFSDDDNGGQKMILNIL